MVHTYSSLLSLQGPIFADNIAYYEYHISYYQKVVKRSMNRMNRVNYLTKVITEVTD